MNLGNFISERSRSFLGLPFTNKFNKKNKKGSSNGTPVVKKLLTDYINHKNNRYLSFSVHNMGVGNGAVTLVVRDQFDELDLNRCSGSNPGRTAPTFVNSNKINKEVMR